MTKCDADCLGGNAFSCADARLVRPRRRYRRRQGKGRTVRRLSWRRRHFADREYSLARGAARSVHSMAAGFFPRRRAQERADAADRRADQQRRHPQSRRLLCLADAAQGSTPDDNPDLSKKGAQAAVGRRCASCHTDTFAGTKAVARIAGQREEYLVKALHDYKSGVRSGGGQGGDGRCRLSPERRGNRPRSRIISRICSSRRCGDTKPLDMVRCLNSGNAFSPSIKSLDPDLVALVVFERLQE